MSIGVTVTFSPNDLVSGRVGSALDFLRGRVLLDVTTSGYEWTGVPLAFRVQDGEVVASAFDGEHDFPVHLEDGAEVACESTMDQVQDGVIDRLGRPWPELLDADGAFVGVLDPGQADGIACWVLRGVPYCAVGQLAGAVPAAGHHLR
jgi:hypothetical protein